MSELDDLPEPVRDAMDDLLCGYVAAKKKDIATIRAEFLHLSSRVKELERENAELRATVDRLQQRWADNEPAVAYKSKLDALKAKIASAPTEIRYRPKEGRIESYRVALLDINDAGVEKT